MAARRNQYFRDVDYKAMWEVLWISVPLFALAGFVLWLMISQSL